MRDPEFFLRRFNPTTSTLMFVEVDIDLFQREFFSWKLEGALTWFPENPKPTVRWLSNDHLESHLRLLLPLRRPSSRALVIETKLKWLAYFKDDYHHPDSANFEHMVRHLKSQSLRFVLCEHNLLGTTGSTQFGHRDETLGQRKTRGVAAHFESRWEFQQWGEPFPFEELETYKAKKIRDRLTPEMLERYAKHFGIDLFDPDFYSGRAFLLEYPTEPPTKTLDRFPSQIPGFTYY